jgi:hypothetical protein
MDLISLLVTILIVGLVVWLLLYIISIIPLPEPFAQVARVLIIVIACIWLIKILLTIGGVHLTL